jgi:23S rRNA (uracil1939-C5)-methyltransferase
MTTAAQIVSARTASDEGEIVVARVDDLNHEGAGVAHFEGKAIFIDGALPGERVRIRYRKRGRHHDRGELIEVLEPSPDRVAPRCRSFGVCGGCTLQHLDGAAQLRLKQKIVSDNLARIGKVEPERWLPPITGPQWGYRRRARLGARFVEKKGGVIVGFHEKRHSFVTPLPHCDVLAPAVARLLPAMRDLIASLSCPDRIPQVEVAVGDDVTALVFRHLVPLNESDVRNLTAFRETHGVQVMLQPHGPEALFLPDASGAPLLHYRLPGRLPEHDIEIAFAANEFIQVNGETNRGLVTRAIELLEPCGDDRVLDLFCGVGNFTLPIARRAGSVLGIEGDARLIARARENAAANGCANVAFRQGNLFTPGEADLPDLGTFNKWLIDPPREGAVDLIRTLRPDKAPARIVYVSCHPATLARDAQILVHAHGYRLAAVGVADMFPQTSHIETIALFERTDNLSC